MGPQGEQGPAGEKGVAVSTLLGLNERLFFSTALFRGLQVCGVTLQGDPGKDGLDGLPGIDGAKVFKIFTYFDHK